MKTTPKKQIKEASKELKKLFQDGLAVIADNLIGQIMQVYRNTTPAQRFQAVKDLQPVGIQQYKAMLIEALASLSQDAIDQARKEVPAAKKIKLDEFDKLPKDLQKIIKNRVDLLVGKQIADMTSILQFSYSQNVDTTDSEAQLEEDISDSGMEFLESASVTSGSEITAATTIADARDAFFFDDEVLEEIEAFEFVNEDPVTPICQDLEGTIFAKDDPNMFRYTPPLHWNCKSWIRPILKGNLGDKEVTKLKPSTKRLEESIQFSEEACLHAETRKCC